MKVWVNDHIEEIEDVEENTIIPNVDLIADFKEKLFLTDYKAIKYAEGILSEEEYAPIKEQRQEWRAEINRLEEELLCQ